MKDLMIMMIGISLLSKMEDFLKGLEGGGETYTLDQIKECAMMAIQKMTDDLREKDKQD